MYVRTVLDTELEATNHRTKSVASFKNEQLEGGEQPDRTPPLKGILRQSAFSEQAAAKSNLESMAEIFTKLQTLRDEQSQANDRLDVREQRLRN